MAKRPVAPDWIVNIGDLDRMGSAELRRLYKKLAKFADTRLRSLEAHNLTDNYYYRDAATKLSYEVKYGDKGMEQLLSDLDEGKIIRPRLDKKIPLGRGNEAIRGYIIRARNMMMSPRTQATEEQKIRVKYDKTMLERYGFYMTDQEKKAVFGTKLWKRLYEKYGSDQAILVVKSVLNDKAGFYKKVNEVTKGRRYTVGGIAATIQSVIKEVESHKSEDTMPLEKYIDFLNGDFKYSDLG